MTDLATACRRCISPALAALASLSLTSCNPPYRSEGEQLARRHCAACHAFPEPELLDKNSWQNGVLPQMAPRLGARSVELYGATDANPNMVVLPRAVSSADWEKIVAYYRDRAPDTLPPQSLPAQPQLDPALFATGPLGPRIESSGIITLLETDTTRERIVVGEAGSNLLRVFDWNRRLVSSLALSSPPTDVIVEKDHVLLLESGILDPNDQPKGRLVRYGFAGADSLRFERVLIDSLFRPVFVQRFDADGDGLDDFLVCEYGDNRGRLALYRYDGARYERRVLDSNPGAIRFELRDMTGDGAPDVVALFGQGDERIVMFAKHGRGRFADQPRVLARFPPVYGSMNFSMHDVNGDGSLDIVYVNGDNFDYSRVLKPYHGIRILENDGKNGFHERYFFPMYGAARAEVADYDRDGDLDILATSNFADRESHPERGIMFLENTGGYTFRPYAFSLASGNRWNLTATGDLDRDGSLDVIVGAMDLDNIANLQRGRPAAAPGAAKVALLLFENRMRAKAR